MTASAQIAIYPLRQDRLSPAVEAVRHALTEAGLHTETGPMSTMVVGDSDAIFAALAHAFADAAVLGHVVMTVTVSNACPIPD
jgi:uncharacterized protein YqgV (UPF0045/DUF77 family)